MLIQEIISNNDRQFKHTYSTDGKYILQIETGRMYQQAYDTMKTNYTYEETDVVIPEEEMENLE